MSTFNAPDSSDPSDSSHPSPAVPDRCPACGGEFVPIVYGLPGPEAWEASQRGKIILGGCVVGLGDEYRMRLCRECGWRSFPEDDWADDEDNEESDA